MNVRHGCGIWKSIQKLRVNFWNYIRFNLGSGREIRFWEDRWIGEVPLKVAFKNLFSLVADPNGLVVDFFYESINS